MSQLLPPGFGEWGGDAKYELRGTLGAGAMGVVMDGFDRRIKRRVAIKVVKKPAADDQEAMEAISRFQREAESAGGLTHPGIVGIYDYGENETTAWIVMEMVTGGTLKNLMDRGDRMPLPTIVRLMTQVLEALHYAHTRPSRVVHRDIKPANIMLTEDGQAKIADFGIARIENSAMTQAGTLMGTPAYMAPEQFRGEPVDPRADLWACGVILYQLLTGEKPFSGGLSALMHRVLTTDPPLPSEISGIVPRAMDAVVMRALAKRMDERWPDAKTFAEAIALAATAPAASPGAAEEDVTLVTAPAGLRLDGVAAPTAVPTPIPAPAAAPASSGRPGWLIPAGGAGALVAAGVAAFLLWPASTPPVVPPTPQPPIGPVIGTGPDVPPVTPPTQTPGLNPVPTPPGPDAPTTGPNLNPVNPPPRIGTGPTTSVPVPSEPPTTSGPGSLAGLSPVPTPNLPPTLPTTPPSPDVPVAITPFPTQPIPTQPTVTPPRPNTPVVVPPVLTPNQPIPTQPTPTQPTPTQPTTSQPNPVPPQTTPPTQPAVVTPPPNQPLPTQPGSQNPTTPPTQTANLGIGEVKPPVEPPPRNPPAQPASVAVPRPDMRAVAQAAIATAPCGLLSARAEDSGFDIQGVLPSAEAGRLRASLEARALPPGAARLNLGVFEGPFCNMVGALRPALAQPGEAPEVAVAGTMPLRKDELLRFDVTMPTWANNLHVAYASSDGQVGRIEPGSARQPGSRVRLGEPRGRFEGWPIDVPFGTDLLLVVVSDGPFFPSGAPQAQSQAEYAESFAAALRAARQAGRRVALRPVVVQTVER
ncbi:serine/threonine-protein kinase [Muricoccus radiodurans]|uniref:serine/threonine-protein kinase n=1 Tax=Muricoccus radiodurans TaxID=2231721 RepID=UPI003CE767F2